MGAYEVIRSAAAPPSGRFPNTVRDDAGSEVSEVLQRLLAVSLGSVSAVSGSPVLINGNQVLEAKGYLSHQGETWETKGEDSAAVIKGGLEGWVVRNRAPVLIPNTLEYD